MTPNAIGRPAPEMVNGRRGVPFQGIGAHLPDGRKAGPPIRSCAQYPADGNKVVSSLEVALRRAGLRDGMVVSSHHHFRDGDLLMPQVFRAAAALGVRDLVWFPSAVFPCHRELLPYLESGVLHHVECSLSGELGEYASAGRMRGLAVVRSHGERYRSLQDGDVQVDIAVIAAPAADPFGNCSGLQGPGACGSLGFALADAQYAEHVIVATEHLAPFPCVPWHIPGNLVDQVVPVERVGEAARIASGATARQPPAEQLCIAEYAARFVREAGLLRPGFSFQAGAGSISLAFTAFLRDTLRELGIKARFIRGGSTRTLVEMLETGLADYLLDGQCFDLEGVRSLRENPAHIATSPFTSYNYHGKGNFASLLDFVVLGATEVDLEFHANAATNSDGRLLHNMGGWQDALFSRCTILTVPTLRKGVPVLRDRVTTLCGPGELIDVVVTERGIAVNPRRTDLLEAVRGSALPLRPLADIKAEAEAVCGSPPLKAATTGQPIGVVTWVDGTVLDTVFAVQPG